MRNSHMGKVFVVDDDSHWLHSISLQLKLFGYQAIPFSDGNEALHRLHEENPDLVISDVLMPKISGIEFLEAIHHVSPETPVILLTGCMDAKMLAPAIRLGAVDYLVKPCTGETIIDSVKKGLLNRRASLHKKRDLIWLLEAEKAKVAWLLESSINNVNNGDIMKEMTRETISILMIAAEMRDDDSGTHISRIGKYAACIAAELDLPAGYRDMIAMASQMHDIGKLSVPDAILLKPGPLTSEEFEVIKRHTLDGTRILGSSHNPVMKMAANIALTHHERWDGSGYPHGLRGEDIPLEGRIVMLADQYDALRSPRVYKKAIPHDQVFMILTEGDGVTETAHFDPMILEAFVRCAADFDDIFNRTCGDLIHCEERQRS